MNVQLLRIGKTSSGPQLGLLLVNATLCCLTLERPWLNNVPQVSCIPAGIYTCSKVTNRQTVGGMLLPVTFEVQEVPDRSGILFHVGNNMEDTNGCILPGLGLNFTGKYPTITESKLAFERFLKGVQDINKFDFKIMKIE